jgi:hypothetical protein
MKRSFAIFLGTASAACHLFAPYAIHAGESARAKRSRTSRPARRPLTRVGGGTRGVGSALAVNVLAPSDTGLPTQEKPTIYWFASQPVDKPVELTITSTESLRTPRRRCFEITLQPPLAKGIHAFRWPTRRRPSPA